MASMTSEIAYMDAVVAAVKMYDIDVVRIVIDRSPMPQETARVARDAILRLISSGVPSEDKLRQLTEIGSIVNDKAAYWPVATASTGMLLSAAMAAWSLGYLESLLIAVKATGAHLLPKVSKASASSALVAIASCRLEDSIYSMHSLFNLLSRYGWLDDDMVALVDILRPRAGEETDII